MSHFTLTARIPHNFHPQDLKSRVAALLAPYCEHDDEGRSKKYMVFHDDEDEHLKKYEEESVEMVRLEDGSLTYPWDNRFRARGSFGAEAPAHLPRVQVVHRERYATFEIFMKDFCGYEKRDAKHGRYGHYRNPNAKWDWWVIGGRWRGHLLVKSGLPQESGLDEVSWVFKDSSHKGPIPGSPTEVDWCRINALDWERIDKLARERAEKFWAEVDQFLSGKEFGFDEGPRDQMLGFGILDCKDEGKLTGNEFWKKAWKNRRPGESARYDVVAVKPDRTALGELVLADSNPIRTYAFLDMDGGWRSKGRMGMWGFSDATPETTSTYVDQFRAWLLSGDQRDWIVTADLHI